MKQAITAEQNNDFQDAMDALARHGVLIVQLPDLEVDRAKAVQAIFQMEAKAINIVTATLRADISKLVPFEWDTPAEQAQKLAAVQQDDRDRRTAWKQAVEANRPASNYSSGSTMRFQSEAYQQLVQIHISGNWP